MNVPKIIPTALVFDRVLAGANPGFFANRRIDRVVASVAATTQPYRIEPLMLAEGRRVFLAGVPCAALDFQGIARWAVRYKNGDRPIISRKLALRSAGWRYDVYVTDPLTRDEVVNHRSSGMLDQNFDPMFCSRYQAFELAVFDKRARVWLNPTWYCLGHNADTIGDTPPDHLQTPLAPYTIGDEARDTLRDAQVAGASNASDRGSTIIRINMLEIMRRVKKVLEERGFVLTTEFVSANQQLQLRLAFPDTNTYVDYTPTQGGLELEYCYGRLKRKVTITMHDLDPTKTTDLGDGYKAFVRVYSLVPEDQKERQKGTIYVGVITVVDETNELYANLIVGLK